MQGLVPFSLDKTWADSYLVRYSPFSSSIKRQEKATYSAVIVTFMLLSSSIKLLLQVTIACLNKLFGNLVLRVLSVTSVLVFRNCYTFLRLLSVLTEHLTA